MVDARTCLWCSKEELPLRTLAVNGNDADVWQIGLSRKIISGIFLRANLYDNPRAPFFPSRKGRNVNGFLLSVSINIYTQAV